MAKTDVAPTARATAIENRPIGPHPVIATVLAEGSVCIDADDLHVLTNVSFAGATLQALAAGYMHLGRDEVAFLHAGNFVAEGHNFAAEFVSGNQRRMDAVLSPAVPVINMKVSAADASAQDSDQNIVDADGRLGYVLEP